MSQITGNKRHVQETTNVTARPFIFTGEVMLTRETKITVRCLLLRNDPQSVQAQNNVFQQTLNNMYDFKKLLYIFVLYRDPNIILRRQVFSRKHWFSVAVHKKTSLQFLFYFVTVPNDDLAVFRGMYFNRLQGVAQYGEQLHAMGNILSTTIMSDKDMLSAFSNRTDFLTLYAFRKWRAFVHYRKYQRGLLQFAVFKWRMHVKHHLLAAKFVMKLRSAVQKRREKHPLMRQCTVCHDAISPEDYIKLPRGHMYHLSCMYNRTKEENITIAGLLSISTKIKTES